jgi:cell division protein FtsB
VTATRERSPGARAGRRTGGTGGTGGTGEAVDTEPSGASRRRAVTALAWFGLLAAVGAVLALLLVKPIQTLLGQRDRYDATTEKLATIKAENERLQTRIAALQQPTEIARTAREQNQRVPPGVRAVIIQPAAAPDTLPRDWPFTLISGIVQARVDTGTASATTADDGADTPSAVPAAPVTTAPAGTAPSPAG